MRVKQVFRKGLQGSLIVLLAAGSLNVGAADNYYRWLDNRGNPVHSDRPPPAGVDYEVVSTRSGLKRVVTGDEGAVPREVEPRVGNEFEAVPIVTEADVRKNPEICKVATENLETLESYARIRVRDDQGNFVYLTETEIAAQKDESLSQIRLHCE